MAWRAFRISAYERTHFQIHDATDIIDLHADGVTQKVID
jgi:hypothetical protein